MKLSEGACKEKLAEYGKDGIEYKNLEPDFSEVSEGTVKIDNMTEHRDDYYDENGELQSGNFSQADAKLAKQWNEQQKTVEQTGRMKMSMNGGMIQRISVHGTNDAIQRLWT